MRRHFGAIGLILILICVTGLWAVHNEGMKRKLEVANGNAAMCDLANEILQYKAKHNGQLPDQLAANTTGNSWSAISEVDDPFAEFRGRWPAVKLIDGPSPELSGVSITYCTSAMQGEFYLIAYKGDRRLCDRTFN